MDPAHSSALKKRIKKLPRSRMVYPDARSDRLKYYFWRLYTPYHPFVRELLTGFGLIGSRKREEYLFGTIAPNALEDFIAHLSAQGFRRHLIAWREKGEIANLRFVRNFSHQYHLRIFDDGEVRGHYEYTPECYPILHLRRALIEDYRREFGDLFRGWMK